MPLLQRLSKRVGCRIWDAIKAKLKELTGREKIDKTLVDYVFVLFDPVNSPEALKIKLKDFLGEQTDQFVEWFSKVISQVDNQVAKVQAGEIPDTPQTSKEASVERTKRSQSREDTSTSARPSNHTPTANPKSIKAEDAALEGILSRRSTSKDASAPSSPTETDTSSRKKKESSSSRRRKDKTGKERREKHRSVETSDNSKDQGEKKVASQMLSKAARDAVKSVQAVGVASASHLSKRQPEVERPAEEEWEGDEDRERNEEKVPEEARSPSPKRLTREEAPPVDHMEEARPIQTIVSRNTQPSKRSFEEVSMDERILTHRPVAITTPNDPSGNRFVYAARQEPLVVPEKEMEENEPMDQDNIPGLLVVMPAQSYDPLSRIKLHPPDRFGLHRFHPNTHCRLPFRPPGYGEGMDYEEGQHFNGMPPMKRQKRVQPNPIDTSLIQCRFLPHCAKKASVCPFYHPPCRNGKDCKFGISCVFDHSGTAPEVNERRLQTKVPLCNYYPKCTNASCQFLHKKPVPCSFGTYCRMGAKQCEYLHSEDVDGTVNEQDTTAADDSDFQIPDYDDESEPEVEHVDHDQGDASNISFEEKPANGITLTV
ncbi:hypothetical protein RvY_11062 [Ramazzottius varieornatus]|uniref:Zinc finger CCCH domain-containing protein 14 n=1 Tax=Ramazzottius varieornatus TaxID=947166 RepID=A0A1D1VEV1_RAMVA|nr:hypothetical protein RvY_11062 [Ramazzottius varieornatus]